MTVVAVEPEVTILNWMARMTPAWVRG
jgi:hypothetical protein